MTSNPPYRVGEPVRVLYHAENGTARVTAHISAIHPHPHGWEITTVQPSGRAATYRLDPDGHSRYVQRILPARDPRVSYGIDHTR